MIGAFFYKSPHHVIPTVEIVENLFSKTHIVSLKVPDYPFVEGLSESLESYMQPFLPYLLA